MPDLVASLLWAAGQVALVSLAAVVVSRRAARRGPEAAAATAVVGMATILVLTALAFCPLPAWWDWPASPDIPDSEEPAAVPGPGAEGPRLAWPVALVGDGRRRLADA